MSTVDPLEAYIACLRIVKFKNSFQRFTNNTWDT